MYVLETRSHHAFFASRSISPPRRSTSFAPSRTCLLIQLGRQGRKKEGDITLGVITMVLVVRRHQIVLFRRKALRAKIREVGGR